jgi:major membrane immunogen (membrane-anchored lipoprotein)
MKAIFSVALVLGVCGLADAADEVEPVGTWKCEYKIGDQKRTADLTIKKDGDKFVGTMSWPDQKDEKLKDVKLKDGTLTYSAVRKFMGQEFPLGFTLTIDGDKFKGKAASEFGGQKQEFDIEGKREKKDK